MMPPRVELVGAQPFAVSRHRAGGQLPAVERTPDVRPARGATRGGASGATGRTAAMVIGRPARAPGPCWASNRDTAALPAPPAAAATRRRSEVAGDRRRPGGAESGERPSRRPAASAPHPPATPGPPSRGTPVASGAPPTADDDRDRHRSGVRSTSLAGFLSTDCRNATPPPHRRARPTSRATPAALPDDRAGQQRSHSGESR
jgi:hypothetical protein